MTLLTIPSHTMHIWYVTLSNFIFEEPSLLALLNPDEVKRAMHFRFPLHRQHFIITRGLLRRTLSLYIGIMPDKITFTYGAHGKPYLQNNKKALHFSVSHSADMAVFALTTGQEVGVDIEKMQLHFKEKIAKRFFSPQEYNQLMALPESARAKGFYQMWSRKEAIIKALGTKLFTSLSDFSINLSDEKEIISLTHLDQQHQFHVENICISDSYQAAVATPEWIEHVVYKQIL